ncbi:DNA-3-methyladenine glycosylase [Candidatus Zixiibacteriota bacterium]
MQVVQVSGKAMDNLGIRELDPPEFFRRPTLTVARDLLGRILLVREEGLVLTGRIIETEAYIGTDDPACHAAVGRTNRNEIMWESPGYAYVYFTYGNHFMLNFVTEKAGFPAAVLIRAAEPLDGIPQMIKRRTTTDPTRLCRGPGNLTAAFGIDRRDNGQPLDGARFGVCRNSVRRPAIEQSGRVGVNEGWEKPWRFFLRDHPAVSAYRRGTKAGRKKSVPAGRK